MDLTDSIYFNTQNGIGPVDNIYSHTYEFVNKLFTTKEENYYFLRKDLKDFLYIKYNLNIDKYERCVLSKEFPSMKGYNFNLIVIKEEWVKNSSDFFEETYDHILSSKTLEIENFLSQDGTIINFILIPEPFLTVGMDIQTRYIGFYNLFKSILTNYLLVSGLNKSSNTFNFIETYGCIYMAAYLMKDNRICSIEDLNDNIIMVDWNELFSRSLYENLIYQISLKIE